MRVYDKRRPPRSALTIPPKDEHKETVVNPHYHSGTYVRYDRAFYVVETRKHPAKKLETEQPTYKGMPLAVTDHRDHQGMDVTTKQLVIESKRLTPPTREWRNRFAPEDEE